VKHRRKVALIGTIVASVMALASTTFAFALAKGQAVQANLMSPISTTARKHNKRPPLTPNQQHEVTCVTDIALAFLPGHNAIINGRKVNIVKLMEDSPTAFAIGYDTVSGQWEELYWTVIGIVPGGSCTRIIIDIAPRPDFTPVPPSELQGLENVGPVKIPSPAMVPGSGTAVGPADDPNQLTPPKKDDPITKGHNEQDGTQKGEKQKDPNEGSDKKQCNPGQEGGPSGDCSDKPVDPPLQQAEPKKADPQPTIAEPYASLDVNSGPPGTAINASGGGFLPNRTITVNESGPTGNRIAASVPADARGFFDIYFRVSDPTLPGRVTLVFKQGDRSVTVHFTITQQASPGKQERAQQPDRPVNGSPCPNGMVRAAPETDTSSGCAPATDKQPQPQQQSDEPSNDSPCPNGMVGPGPDAQGHSGCYVQQKTKTTTSSPTETTEPDPRKEIATDEQGGDPSLCADHPTYEWCH
jgi:hypothetical protein